MKHTYRGTLHACYLGYITQAIVANLAPILFIIFQSEFGISFEQIGRLILINFATQILVDYLAVRYVDRMGYRCGACLAHIFAAVGLISMGIFPLLLPAGAVYPALTVSVILYAVGGGLIEVLVSPMVDSLPGTEKASAMSLLHAFYCWGQVLVVLLSTLYIKFFGSGVWYILPILWAAVPIFNFFRFLKVPILSPVSGHEKASIRELFSSRVFLAALILMMCAGASELAMSQWSSLFAEEGLGVPKMVGDLLGPCLFAVFMGIGRTIYGVYGAKINLRGAMFGCAVLCVACYAVTTLVPIPLVALLGCAFCGFTVSLMWPGTLSLASAKLPNGGTAMFGIFAIAGDVGCSIGPWLVGIISDGVQNSAALTPGADAAQMGLKAGLLAAIVFPLLMILGLIIMNKREA